MSNKMCNCKCNFFIAIAASFIAVAFLLGCGTTSDIPKQIEADKLGNVDVPDSNASASEIDSPESFYFSDWEYRGFGRKLPDWVEPAFLGGSEKVQKDCPRFSDVQVLVVSVYGMNPDQVVRKLFEETSHANIGEQFTPIETLWVHLATDASDSRGEYMALQLYVSSTN